MVPCSRTEAVLCLCGSELCKAEAHAKPLGDILYASIFHVAKNRSVPQKAFLILNAVGCGMVPRTRSGVIAGRIWSVLGF